MTPEPDQPLNLLQALVSLLVPSVAVQNGIPEADENGAALCSGEAYGPSLTRLREARRAVGCSESQD